MSPELLTSIASVVIAALGVVFIPAYLARRAERAAIVREEAARMLALETGSDVSWEAINRAIVHERDALQIRLEDQQKKWTSQIVDLQTSHRIELQRTSDRHHDETTEMRGQCDQQIREARASLEREIETLTQELANTRSELTRTRQEMNQLHATIYRLQNTPDAK